ncbi:MAG: 50S ribosomal protein L1 [Candidatus Omnitrophica bacterium]|nr:50S ribosomal protein L1 [Candidatus Omnitrophota bacterium]
MTRKSSKRYQEAAKQVSEEAVSVQEAVKILKAFPSAKFDESIEVSFQLGIDPKQSAQVVRGTVSLPHGTGKSVKVLVFCRGEAEREAQEAGADYVGADELINKVAGGWTDFDVVVAHPNVMKEISKLGKILGPRGLMPSPKVGTVTQDVGKAVREVKKGKIEFKSDKTGGLHVACGKVSFAEEKLVDNIKIVIKTILDNKPSSAKGTYIHNVAVSTSMGPGVAVNVHTMVEKK